MIATEAGLGVRSSAEVLFFIITGPVGAYYARGSIPRPHSLLLGAVMRAPPGGVGVAKTGGKLWREFPVAKNAKARFDQVLWLDAECRCSWKRWTMNIFFVLRRRTYHPPLFPILA